MNRFWIPDMLDSGLALHNLAGGHRGPCSRWVSARAVAAEPPVGRQHPLVGKGLWCRSRSRPVRRESPRLRAETSQPSLGWSEAIAGKATARTAAAEASTRGRGHTVGLSLNGRAPAPGKGWWQGSGRDPGTLRSPRARFRGRFTPHPRFVWRAMRPWQGPARRQGPAHGTYRGRGSSAFWPASSRPAFPDRSGVQRTVPPRPAPARVRA